MGEQSLLDEEIESWKGFPWALRKDDLELWNAMTKEVRNDFGEAVEKSGKTFTTDPFFMSLLLAQQRTIRRLQAILKNLLGSVPDSDALVQIRLDGGGPESSVPPQVKDGPSIVTGNCR